MMNGLVVFNKQCFDFFYKNSFSYFFIEADAFPRCYAKPILIVFNKYCIAVEYLHDCHKALSIH